MTSDDDITEAGGAGAGQCLGCRELAFGTMNIRGCGHVLVMVETAPSASSRPASLSCQVASVQTIAAIK